MYQYRKLSRSAESFTLRNVFSVPWGIFLVTVGGYLEYRGGLQYRGTHDIPPHVS